MTQHWRRQASVAYGYSLTRLALNYYTYFEDAEEEAGQECLRRADEQFHQALGAWLAGERPLESLQSLREEIRQEMETVTAYTDCFRIYEYALNRLERRVDPDLPSLDVEEGEFVRRLVHFVTDTKEAAVMNQRIQMIIGQLPVRFTRQKFYGMVMEGLSAYIGADQSGLDNMMYLLRTSAMVELTPEQTQGYHDLNVLLEQLKNLPYKDLEAGQYREAIQKIGYASEVLYLYADTLQMLQDMVNDLYVLCLTRTDAMKDAKEEENALFILKGLYERHQNQAWGEIEDAVTERLYLLEGVQESYYEKYQRLDPAAEYQKGEDETAFWGRCVDRLLSASSFAPLEDPCAGQTVERADVEAAANALIARLDPVFSEQPKPVVRAIMATVLANLPVCFNSLDEIQSYIANSFASCTDQAEKETCMELLQQLMEYEEYGMV